MTNHAAFLTSLVLWQTNQMAHNKPYFEHKYVSSFGAFLCWDHFPNSCLVSMERWAPTDKWMPYGFAYFWLLLTFYLAQVSDIKLLSECHLQFSGEGSHPLLVLQQHYVCTSSWALPISGVVSYLTSRDLPYRTEAVVKTCQEHEKIRWPGLLTFASAFTAQGMCIYLPDSFLPNMCPKRQECDTYSVETKDFYCFPLSKYHLEFHWMFDMLDISQPSLYGAGMQTRTHFNMIITFIEFILPPNPPTFFSKIDILSSF